MAAQQDTERKAKFLTGWGLELKRFYTPQDLAGWDYEDQAGYPGEYPYTRGIYPSLYRSRLWTMRQYAGFGSARESNARYRYLLSQGQTGLSVAFDLPTQIGLDSDHPAGARVKWAAWVWPSTRSRTWNCSSRDIPLERVSASMTINATGGDSAGTLFRRGRKARR